MILHFKHLIQTLAFFLVESMITTMVIFPIWYLFIHKYFVINFGFFDILFIIFLIKLILGNVFSTVLELDRRDEYNKELNAINNTIE